MPQPATEQRYFATCEIVQANPGYREARISIHHGGDPDAFALIALTPSSADTPDALAAFGWRPVEPLEYIAGLNQERGEVEPTHPAAGPGAERLRETVRREIRARTLARRAHPTAAHFHAVHLNANRSADPIGWTFRVGHGDSAAFAWVTAAGHVGDTLDGTSRPEATRTVRHQHMIDADSPATTKGTFTALEEKPGPELARLLYIVRSGQELADLCALIGPAAPDASEDQAEPEEPTFRRGDRLVCADGVTRTVQTMAPVTPGEPAHVIVEGGTEWIAAHCLRANHSDILAAHRRCKSAAARVRTDPDPTAPEWRAALAELTAAHDFLCKADPTVRVALAEDDARKAAKRAHPDAHHFQPVHRPGEGEPSGWTFRTGRGSAARYGVVTIAAEVSPIGLHEYHSTAESAFLRSQQQDPARS